MDRDLKVLPIAVGQRLDYDSDENNVATGNGRTRVNVRQDRLGVVTPISEVMYKTFNYPLIGMASDGDYLYAIMRINGTPQKLNVYRNAYKKDKFLPNEWNKIGGDYLVTQGNFSENARVEASNGYILIVEDGDGAPAPMLIDTKRAIFISDGIKVAVLSNTLTREVYIRHTELDENEWYVWDSSDSCERRETICGKVTITRKEPYASIYDHYLDISWPFDERLDKNVYLFRNSGIMATDAEMGITHKNPKSAPFVKMVNDPRVLTNHFKDNVYAYAYSFIYEDGYETPLSAFTEPNIEAQQAQLRRQELNVAEISIIPYPGVKRVRFYVKANAASNPIYMVGDVEAKGVTTFRFDGSQYAGVMDNSLWVKTGENIPFKPKVGKFIDNRLVFGGTSNEYTNNGTRLVGTTIQEWKKVKGTTKKYTGNPTGFTLLYNGGLITGFSYKNNTINTSVVTSNFNPNGTMGTFGLDALITVKLTYKIPTLNGYVYTVYTYDIPMVGSVNYNSENYQAVGDRLADKIKNSFSNDVFYVSEAVSDSYSRITVSFICKIMASYLYNIEFVEAKKIQYVATEGYPVFDRSLKLNSLYTFGVEFFDEYGRSAGVYTGDDCVDGQNIEYSVDSVQVVKPRFYLNYIPSWAKYYQFCIQRQERTFSHHFVPAKFTAGGWGSTNEAVKTEGEYTLIALNFSLKSSSQKDNVALYYTFHKGDMIRLYRVYKTDGTFVNILNGDDKGVWCKVVDVKVDGDYEYMVVEGMSADVAGEFNNSLNAFLQFEVENMKELQASTGNIWMRIGEVYDASKLTDKPYVETRDGYLHDVDYGDVLVRPVSGIYIDRGSATYKLYTESEKVNDQSVDKVIFSSNRPTLVVRSYPQYINRLIYSRPYIYGVDFNGFNVYDYDAILDIPNDTGTISVLAANRNKLYVFGSNAITTVNLSTVEVTMAQGGDVLYKDSFLGNYRVEYNRSCLRPNNVLVADDVFYYDNTRRELCMIADNGIYSISGVQRYVNGAANHLMASVFYKEPTCMGYDYINRELYVSFLNAGNNDGIFVYDDVQNIWTVKRSYRMYRQMVWYDRLYAIGENYIMVYVDRLNGESAGTNTVESVTGWEYDAWGQVGLDADFMAIVLHASKPMLVKIYVYDNSGICGYTEVNSEMFRRYGNAYYADIPKGTLGSTTLHSHMLYEGYDMVGRTIRLVAELPDANTKLYGFEIRYMDRQY